MTSNSSAFLSTSRPVVAPIAGGLSPYNNGDNPSSSPSNSTTAAALQILAEAEQHQEQQEQQRRQLQRERELLLLERPRKEDRELSELVEAEDEEDDSLAVGKSDVNELHLLLLNSQQQQQQQQQKPQPQQRSSPTHYAGDLGGDLLPTDDLPPPSATATASRRLRLRAQQQQQQQTVSDEDISRVERELFEQDLAVPELLGGHHHHHTTSVIDHLDLALRRHHLDLAAEEDEAVVASVSASASAAAAASVLSPMRHSPLYSATGLPGTTASRYNYQQQSPIISSSSHLLPPPARPSSYIPTPTPQPPLHSHDLHHLHNRPVFSRSHSVPDNTHLIFDSEDEELLLLEAAATASANAGGPSPTFPALDEHLLNPALRQGGLHLSGTGSGSLDPLLRPSTSASHYGNPHSHHHHLSSSYSARGDPLLLGGAASYLSTSRRPHSRRSTASDRDHHRLIRNPFATSTDVSAAERYLRLHRHSRSSDLPTSSTSAHAHHQLDHLGGHAHLFTLDAKLEAAKVATRRLTDRELQHRNGGAAAAAAQHSASSSSATERRRAAYAREIGSGPPLTLSRSLLLVTENASRRAQAAAVEQRKKSVRFGAGAAASEDLEAWSSLLGPEAAAAAVRGAELGLPVVAHPSGGGTFGLGLETEDAWMTVEDVRSGRWARWDALCKQESQDSQTRDSGIETGSCFTSSEDSNRGSAADHHSHHYHHHHYYHHSRKVSATAHSASLTQPISRLVYY